MSERALVLYDGQCRLCLASVRRLRRLDWLGRLAYGDARDESVRRHVPDADEEALLRRLHLVPPRGAKALDGFYAFRWIAGRLPLLWILWPFLWIPGVAPLGVRVYDAVARNRFAFGTCDDEACDVRR